MLRAAPVVIACVGFLLLAPRARAGDVEGKVELPEKRAKGKMYNDRRYPGTVPQGADRGRGPALVFLEPLAGGAAPAPPAEKPKLEQRNRQFHPLLLPVVVGTTVEFPNYDEEYHNVFSRSETKELELGRYGKGERREVTFDKPGLVRLRCEVHSSMHAVIVVLPTPYWAVADEAGKFSLKGVPAGKYRAWAFHEDARPKEKGGDPLRAFGKEIEVPAEGSVSAEFDLRGEE